PRETNLPQVERLFVGYGEMLFEKQNFPEIRHLEFILDRKRIMLQRLKTFTHLRALCITPCPKDIFEIVDELNIGYLRLNNSSLETLNGIERLGALTDLWLKKWTKLKDLSPLARLPLLEDLTLSYCKRIISAESLIKIPNLKRLFVWLCNSKAIEQLTPDL